MSDAIANPHKAGRRLRSEWMQPLGLIGAAIGGFLLLQKAFQAGSLTNALVSYTLVEIVLAVLLGIMLFGEKPHSDALSLGITAAASILMIAGIVSLAGARPEAADSSQPRTGT